MKIAIGFQIKNNSWGGGNQFAISLVEAAKSMGHLITYNLDDRDIDIILFTDPRAYNDGVNFDSAEIINYLLFKNKYALVVHRINECDERKNTFHMNNFLRWSNYCADHTVFISSWLKKLDIYQRSTPSSVILNGASTNFFKRYANNVWDQKNRLKIVTHHWSPNYMKGFDVYKEIDNLLLDTYWESKIEFTYIGNLPNNFNFKKANHIPPINGKALGIELSKHHIYLSASINEPAGMHHIEGILCGLPIIYRESGALPEYCKKYGISFKNEKFLPALKKMFSKYDQYKKIIGNYPNNSDKMSNEYLNLFNFLIDKRELIVRERNLFRSPLLLIQNQVFILMRLINVVRFFKRLAVRKFI